MWPSPLTLHNMSVNPLTPTVAIWVQRFAIFDIRALWHSALSVRVSGCQKITNDRLNPVWHRLLYSCTIWQQWASRVNSVLHCGARFGRKKSRATLLTKSRLSVCLYAVTVQCMMTVTVLVRTHEGQEWLLFWPYRIRLMTPSFTANFAASWRQRTGNGRRRRPNQLAPLKIVAYGLPYWPPGSGRRYVTCW